MKRHWMRRALAGAALATLALGTLAAPASADPPQDSSVRIFDGQHVVFTAGNAQSNNVVAEFYPAGPLWRFTDNSKHTIFRWIDDDGFADCYYQFPASKWIVDCPVAAGSFTTVNTKDRNDTVVVNAPGANVTVNADAGNDTITTNTSNSTVVLNGGPGNDTFPQTSAPNGGAIINGGIGSDTVSYADRTQHVEVWQNGQPDDGYRASAHGAVLEGDNVGLDVETIVGGSAFDFLVGGDINNVILGGAGADGTWGGDHIYGQGGNDWLLGGADSDIVFGGAGTDVILGEDGADQLTGDNTWQGCANFVAGNDTILGGNGDDWLYGMDGNDKLYGEAGNDTLFGDRYVCDGGSGNDQLDGGTGTDTLDGQAGIDVADYSLRTESVVLHLTGTANSGASGENDTLANLENAVAGSGSDIIVGTAAANVLFGNAGDDIIFAGAGNDLTVGGLGNDTTFGGEGDDYLSDSIPFYAPDGGGFDQWNCGPGTDTVSGLEPGEPTWECTP